MPLLDRAGPVPGLAGWQVLDPDWHGRTFVADLALRAMQHQIEFIIAEIELDIGEFIASIAAVGLIGAQFTVAVQLDIPARWQDPADRRQSEARWQVQRTIGHKSAAPIRALRRQRGRRGIDIAQREAGRFERSKQGSVRVVAIKPQPQRIGQRAVAARNPGVIAQPDNFAAGQRLVLDLPAAALAPLRLHLHIDRWGAPGPIRRVGMRHCR